LPPTAQSVYPQELLRSTVSPRRGARAAGAGPQPENLTEILSSIRKFQLTRWVHPGWYVFRASPPCAPRPPRPVLGRGFPWVTVGVLGSGGFSLLAVPPGPGGLEDEEPGNSREGRPGALAGCSPSGPSAWNFGAGTLPAPRWVQVRLLGTHTMRGVPRPTTAPATGRFPGKDLGSESLTAAGPGGQPPSVRTQARRPGSWSKAAVRVPLAPEQGERVLQRRQIRPCRPEVSVRGARSVNKVSDTCSLAFKIGSCIPACSQLFRPNGRTGGPPC
jgi:hypothetical protein